MQNQTEEHWLVDSPPGEWGTGVFAFPESQSAEFGTSDWVMSLGPTPSAPSQKALVQNLSYVDCAKRGEQSWMLAYKWVPQSLASYAEVLAAAQSCTPTRCVRRCARYGCLCVAGVCK